MIIISPKIETFGDIMFLVVTNTPFKFIFAIAIEVPDYKNPMIFGINRKNKIASGGHFV